MFVKAVTFTLALATMAGFAHAQQRVNEVSPGRGQEILKMQTVPQVTLPPEPTNSNPRPYPVETTYPYVGVYPPHYGYGYPYYNNYPYGYNPYINGYYQPVVVVPQQTVQVPQQAAPPPKQMTELDYAMDAVRDGKTSVAIDRLLEHLKQKSDDFVSMRLIGLMYLEEKQPSEAAARISYAYKRMPQLARRPIDSADIGLDSARLREMVVKASKYANKMKTGSSWLMVTVLMQAEGRTDMALANLAKAESAGLDQETVAAIRYALSPMETEQVPAAAPLKENKDSAGNSESGAQKSKTSAPKNP